MIFLGFALPIMILTMTRTFFKSWRVWRLFVSYLWFFATLHILFDYLEMPKSIVYVVVFILGLFEASNLEHIINNNSNQNLKFITFLFDPVFMKGSGLTKRFFFRVLGIEVILLGLANLQLDVDLKLLSFFALTLFLIIAVPRSSLVSDWLQESWLVFNLGNLLNYRIRQTKTHLRKEVKWSTGKLDDADRRYGELRPQEKGIGKWHPGGKGQNILLIMVEGIGEVHLKKGWLPKLEERRKKHTTVKTFINHQRNTNRGIYSLLTGKHPNLVSQMAKPDLVAQYGKIDLGLADFLSGMNYSTEFLQAAPTVFMSKNRFLLELGFQKVIGEESFSSEVPRIKWGVDDHELYKISREKIKELRAKDRPWFLSVLTVSTHHPFQAANKVLKTAEEGFRYADEELDLFLNQLEEDGVLDSTLVVITSDETAGEGGHILSDSLGTMTLMIPDGTKRDVEEIITQSDVAYSVLDYLNVENHPFLGRSLFREYREERPIIFANIFQQKAYCYFKQELLIRHYSGKEEFIGFEKLSLDCLPKNLKYADSSLFLQEFIEASDRGIDFLSSPIIMDIATIEPTGEDVVKSGGAIKTGLKKGQKIHLKFVAENENSDTAIVLNWLIQDMKNKRSFKLNNIILPKVNETFEKSFVSPDDAWYDLSFKVITNKNQTWKIKDLQVSE